MVNADLEIRKLDQNLRYKLADILGSDWKIVMQSVPKEVGRNGEIIDASPKYDDRHVSLIENATRDQHFQILIDEWGTSGRIRPTMAHLFQIVTECELFRAADSIANMIGAEYPKRPTKGPAAVVLIPPKDENMEQIDNSIPRNTTGTIEIQNRNDANKIEKGYEAVNKILLPNHTQNSPSANPATSGSTVPSTRIASLTSHSQIHDSIPSQSNPIRASNSLNNHIIATNRTVTNSINLVLQHSNTHIPSLPLDSQSNFLPNFDLMNASHSISNNNSYQPQFSALISNNISHAVSASELPAVLFDKNQSDDMIPDFDKINLNSTSSLTSPQSQSFQDSTSTSYNSNRPNFGALMSSTSLSHVENSANSTKRLKHFSFDAIKSATDNFNTNPFNSIDYFDGRKLGSGGFSDVFLAINLESIQYSAVKKLRNDFAKFKQKFDLEIQILSQLTHSNLINLLGYSQDLGEYCLIYEFIRGGNLEEKLTKARLQLELLTWQQRINIAIGCAEGLAYLHQQNIIHRDIKSSNILLAHDLLIPKICDFGLIRELDSTVTTQPMGTFAYAAPEIFHGQTTSAADIYSFGVVLLEIVTGLRFIDDQRPNRSLVMHFNELLRSENFTYNMIIDRRAGDWGQIVSAPGVCSAHVLLDLCRKCLQNDMTQRPSSAHVISLFLKDCSNKFS